MPLEDFMAVAKGMEKYGYNPSRFRPYAEGGNLRVAAVWSREGKAWRLAHDLALEEIRKQNFLVKQQGFQPADATVYRVDDQDGERNLFAGLWLMQEGEDDAAMFVGTEQDDKVIPARGVNGFHFVTHEVVLPE